MVKPKKLKNRRRRNQALPQGLPGIGAVISKVAGDLAITGAVAGCTLEEKLLIAGLLPSIVSIIKTIPVGKIGELALKVYPPPDPKDDKIDAEFISPEAIQ